MLVIALAIKCDSKGPVLFKQKRVGKDKKHFMILVLLPYPMILSVCVKRSQRTL